MSAVRLPQLGNVVWAEFEDDNGYRKARPAVVVSPTNQIANSKVIRLVAISTRLSDPLPNEYVLLPWDPQGRARSGLKRKCAAVASWQSVIPVEDVQQVVGVLPASTIAELLAKIATVLPERQG